MKRLLSYFLPIVFYLLLTALPTTLIHSQQLSWQETNSVKDYPISAFLSKENTLFSTTLGGGIYKTNDEGKVWKNCNNGLSGFMVTSLVWHQTSLFAGTYDGSVTVL